MRRVRVVQITALVEVPADELFARIDGATRAPGEFAVELRDPELDGRQLYELGLELRRRTRRVGALLLVNDRLDLAMLLEADGVHLGRRSVAVSEARAFCGEHAWVSVSAHADDDVDRAVLRGASAVVLAPIFASPEKGAPLGVEALERARGKLPEGMALWALGGVTPDNAASCFAAGADAVAAIRADLTSI
jgi:thiamine-phosphate pyrophosphorylase